MTQLNEEDPGWDNGQDDGGGPSIIEHPFILTQGQQKALDDFLAFLMDPTKPVFVLEGYAGTGKSTLIKHLLDVLPKFVGAMKLINPSAAQYEVQLTATTNKAADVLGQMSGLDVTTIHSFLGLRVHTDYKTQTTTLKPSTMEKRAHYLLFVDEASFVDTNLLRYIFALTEHCKIVFMGDRGQLSPVKTSGIPPVFAAGFPGAMLTEVMRQTVNGIPQANPITELATGFREAITTGVWPKIRQVPGYINLMTREEFNAAIEAEFTRPDWRYSDSKVLGWTNKCVIEYNTRISDLTSGSPHLEQWDYAMCNKNVTIGNNSIKTDQYVQITEIEDDSMEYDCPGNWVVIDHRMRCFFPKSLADRKEAYKRAQAKESYNWMRIIDREWIDLRHVFACTVNKSQGSTFDKAYVNLPDIRRCNSGDAIARMLYVATSRARVEVNFLKG